MRNLIKGMTVLVASVVMGSVSLVPAGADTLCADWRFNSSANPAVPEATTGSPQGARLAVAVGDFGSGWHHQLPGLGETTGYWDLGRSGRLQVAGLGGTATTERIIRVKVSQWQDGLIFSAPAQVSVPGATFVRSEGTQAGGGAVGGWVAETTVWKAASGATVEDILITGAYNGSVVENVFVETAASVPVSLNIVPGASQSVTVSWLANAEGYQLESTGDMADPQSWELVSGDPQRVGDSFVVSVPAGGRQQFFRLRRP